jgi:hypothetical protein
VPLQTRPVEQAQTAFGAPILVDISMNWFIVLIFAKQHKKVATAMPSKATSQALFNIQQQAVSNITFKENIFFDYHARIVYPRYLRIFLY